MKRILATALLLVTCIAAKSHAAAGQSKDARAGRELMQLERDWSAAYLKHDTATIARILADDYVGIDGRGIIMTKSQEIDEAREPGPRDSPPPFVILDESVTDLKARVYGDVAVVNGRVIEKIRSQDKEGEIQYRRTTIWVKRQGRWQCVSFHGSRILEPPKP